MRQEWILLNQTKKEVCTLPNCGFKWLEQRGGFDVSTAMMLLLTDVDSLGKIDDDLILSQMPPEIKTFITPVIGKWTGDQISYFGTSSNKYDGHFNDLRDITDDVAKACTALSVFYQDPNTWERFELYKCLITNPDLFEQELVAFTLVSTPPSTPLSKKRKLDEHNLL